MFTLTLTLKKDNKEVTSKTLKLDARSGSKTLPKGSTSKKLSDSDETEVIKNVMLKLSSEKTTLATYDDGSVLRTGIVILERGQSEILDFVHSKDNTKAKKDITSSLEW